MTTQGPSRASRIGTVLMGFLFVVATVALGALLGAATVRFLMPKAADGWNGIARALGGLMVGGGGGLGVSLLLLLPLARRGVRALAMASAVAAAGVALVAGLFAVTRPERPASSPPPEHRAAFQPLFRVEVRVALADERLRALPAGSGPLAAASLRVETFGKEGPHLDLEELGPARRACSAALEEGELRSVLQVLRPATALSGVCRTPAQDVPLAVSWSLADAEPARGNATVEAECLADRPPLDALISTMRAIAEARRHDVACREIPAS